MLDEIDMRGLRNVWSKNNHPSTITLLFEKKRVKCKYGDNIYAKWKGKGIVNSRTDSKWFKRFREGDISLEDKPRMGRPHMTDIETLRFMVMDNSKQSSREMSARLGPSKIRSTELCTSFTLLANTQDKIHTT
ncbi:hypothetical protein LAZ67_13002804 [Cordylochernes scorpioides]|uniref:Transposase n=1 Tax=Cordylochernes scorpioides TaxID=51811 RepID=A0ABY6L798_9ARAC|nr:hypothetical protein LAZ67_13002804 [Cordylochernes scorpioides]